MHIFQKCLSALLALCLLFSLAACGKAPDMLGARFNVLYRTEFPPEYAEGDEPYCDPEHYACYNAEITISNNNDFAVNVLHAETRKPSDNVFLFITDEGTIGLPAQFTGEQTVYYQVLADNTLSMDEVLEALGKMDVRLQYVDASTGIEDLSEVKEEQLLESAILYQP